MNDLKSSLYSIRDNFQKELSEIETSVEADAIRVRYFGKKGELTALLRGMGSLSAEERPVVGQLVNDIREEMEIRLNERISSIVSDEKAARLLAQTIDVTMPAKPQSLGTRHPIYMVVDEICNIFLGLGFSIAEGPEVEYDSYGFEKLRLPKGHPARDTQDTFYFSENILLRPQTSPVQIRVMEVTQPPIRIVCPGKVYRSDTLDSTHSPIFHQIEGLVVDKGITMGDLVGSLQLFTKKLFGENSKIRLRPHHFPFTEPSAEMDGTCFVCHGEGCKVCKGEGFMELLGCGMVHPEVLKKGGIDPEVYSGFAFGFGLDRMTMQKFGIDDIRLLYESDMRFLKQFK